MIMNVYCVYVIYLLPQARSPSVWFLLQPFFNRIIKTLMCSALIKPNDNSTLCSAEQMKLIFIHPQRFNSKCSSPYSPCLYCIALLWFCLWSQTLLRMTRKNICLSSANVCLPQRPALVSAWLSGQVGWAYANQFLISIFSCLNIGKCFFLIMFGIRTVLLVICSFDETSFCCGVRSPPCPPDASQQQIYMQVLQ